MTLDIIQYLIKGVIVLFGVVIFFNVFELDMPENTRRVIGLIVILFGIYRLLIYKMKKKKYQFEVEEDEED